MISSPISWHLRGGMARVGGASFQRAGRSVGTGVQLNGDGLDPAHAFVAVVAAKFFKFKVENLKLDVTSSLNL